MKPAPPATSTRIRTGPIPWYWQPGGPDIGGIQQVAGVDDRRAGHQAGHLGQVQLAKLRPLGQHHQCAGVLARRVRVVAQLQVRVQSDWALAGVGQGGVERLDVDAPCHEPGAAQPAPGDSRRSSVAALKVRPQAATVMGPLASAGGLSDLVCDQVELALVGDHRPP